MRVGELSARSGASARSLRYYEAQGLLTSGRTAGGHREYGEDAVERVDRIRCLLDAGLGTTAIRELLPCMYAQERGDPAPDLVDWLRLERSRVTEAICELERTRESLDRVIENADGASALRDGASAPGDADLGGGGAEPVRHV